MNAPMLRLRYEPDDEWLGELHATVSSGYFSGRASAYFDREQLRQKFVVALKNYPLDPDAPPLIEGGFWDAKRTGVLDQCHLRIAILPFNTTGSLLVRVELSTPAQSSPDHERQQTVTVRFLTEYQAIAEFADTLSQVLDGTKEEALLSGTLV